MSRQSVFDKISEELRAMVANHSPSPCESLFDRFPEIRTDRDTALEIIYYEYVLRKEQNHEEKVSTEEFCRRFPEYRDDIVKLFQVDEAFQSLGMEGASATSTLDQAAHRNPVLIENGAESDVPLYLGTIGDYRLVEVIGRGGMGMVYRAVQERLRRDVALKTISLIESLDPDTISRFRNEAELQSSLQHPNIAQIYEVGSQHQVPYYSMEFVSGGSLSDAMQNRPLKPDIAARLVSILARAADHAHERGIVHRDLKPGNILLAPSHRPEAIPIPINLHEGVTPPKFDQRTPPTSLEPLPKFEPKIIDFGLATRFASQEEVDDSAKTVGTPSFMAPEQIDTSLGRAGPSNDIYALGAILYHLLVGRPPFHASTTSDTLRQVLEDEPISPRSLQPRISVDLETICLKCLRKNPQSRYGSALELANDLQRYLDRVPIKAKPVSIFETTWKWARRHPSQALLVLATTTALLAITSLWRISAQSLRSELSAKQRSDQLIYNRDIALASFEYRSNNVERTKSLLENSNSKFRNWEWDYLNNLCNESIWKSPNFEVSTSADLSPDGRYVVTSHGAWSKNTEQYVEVWDSTIDTCKHRVKVHENGSVTDVRISPDGKSFLTMALVWGGKLNDGSLSEWSIETGELISKYSDGQFVEGCYHPDGQSIFAGTSNGSIVRYSRTTKKLTQTLKRHQGIILAVSVSPDGTRLASSSREGVICLWDTKTGKELDCIFEIGDPRQILFSPDQKQLYVVDFSGIVRTFLIKDDRLVLQSELARTSQPLIALSPDGLTMATAVFGDGADLRDRHTGKIVRKLYGHRGHVRAVRFDRTGERLLTTGIDGVVRIWDTAFSSPFAKHKATDGAAVAAIRFRPEHAQFAVGMRRMDGHPLAESGIPRVEIWDSNQFKRLSSILGHQDWITFVEFNASGSQLLTGSKDRTARIWNPDNGMELVQFPLHNDELVFGTFLANQNTKNEPSVVTLDRAGKIHVWNAKTAESIWSGAAMEDKGMKSSISAACYFPAQNFLVVAQQYRSVLQIWNLTDGKLVGTTSTRFKVNCFAVSPDSKSLAIASESNDIEIWNLDRLHQMHNAEPNLVLQGHSDQVKSLCFNEDGSRLVATGMDESIRLFDVQLGSELMIIDTLKGVDMKVAFSSDSRQIVRAEGRRISLWSKSTPADNQSADETDAKLKWHKEKLQVAVLQQNMFAAKFHAEVLKKLAPSDPFAWSELAQCHVDQRNWIEAERELLTALEIGPNAKLWDLLVRTYIALGSAEPLHDACRHSIDAALATGDETTINQAVWNCALSGDPGYDVNKLVEMMKELCSASPKGHLFNTLALAQYRAGQFEPAIESCQMSMKIKARDSQPFDWVISSLCRAKILNHSSRKDPRLSSMIMRDVQNIQNWITLNKKRDQSGLQNSAWNRSVEGVELPKLLAELNSELEQVFRFDFQVTIH